MEEVGIWENLRNVVVKIIIPGLVGVSINLAIQARKKTMSVFNVVTSLIVGLGVAWILSPAITAVVSEEYRPPLIALVALSGDKIATWAIVKFNVDRLINLLIDWYRK